ncbi:MAG: hypothetical protein U0183_12080 [Polyangiaceae bacterium]
MTKRSPHRRSPVGASPPRVGRRPLLLGALGGLLLGAFGGASTGCASDEAPAPRTRRTVQKSVHLGLARSALASGPLRGAARLELRVGAARIPLVAHDEKSLDAARAGSGEALTKRLPTHYAKGVRFSAEAAQSYFVYRVSANGTETLVGAAIHVPTEADLRGVAPDDDPREVMTLEDAAIWAVFNNPHVMAHDPETARKVIALIGEMPSYPALVDAIDQNFHTVTPEEAEQLVGGWIVGQYRALPPSMGGGFATEVDLTGAEILDATGKPRRVVDWILSSDESGDVSAAAIAVTDELVRRFNDDAAFEGVKYFRYPGVGRTDGGTVTARRPGSNAATTFLFDAVGTTTEHRKLSVETEGSELKVVVDNYLALGCLFGVSHFDKGGAHLATKTLGYVGSTYYPDIMRATGGHSTGEASFERPEEAATSKVWTCAPAFHHGDLGPHADAMSMTWRAFAVWALSGLCDLVLPGIFLASGLIGAGHAGEEIFEHVAKEIGIDAFVDVVKGIAASVINVSDGQSVLSVLGELAFDVAKLIFRLAEKLVASRALAAVVAKVFAVAGAETSASMATPFLGWVTWAVSTLQTAAQLVMSNVHLAGSTIFTHGTLLYTHPLTVTAKVKDSPYFPSYASHYRATVSLASGADPKDTRAFVPIVQEGPLPTGTTDRFDLRFPDVPTSFPLRLQVTLFDGSPSGHVNQVGDGLDEALENEDTPGKEQGTTLEIAITPLPVDAQMGLVHDVIYTPSRGTWDKAPAPEGDDRLVAFGLVPASVSSLGGISLRQTSGVESRLAYAFDTEVAKARGTVTVSLGNAPAIAPSSSAASASRSPFGPGALRHMLYSLSGRRVILAQASASDAISVHVLPSGAPDVDLATWTPPARPFAKVRGSVLRSARLSPDGTRLVVCLGSGVEIFDFTSPVDEPDGRAGRLLYRRGVRAGCVEVPIAAAGFHHADRFAVLDAGNARVEVFDYDQNLVPDAFETPISLATGSRRYLDLDVDVVGNLWIVSLEPGTQARPGRFFLDIYSAQGKLVRSFDTVRAMRIALDRFNQLFTLNALVSPGPLGYPEPTASRFSPTHPAVSR